MIRFPNPEYGHQWRTINAHLSLPDLNICTTKRIIILILQSSVYAYYLLYCSFHQMQKKNPARKPSPMNNVASAQLKDRPFLALKVNSY